MAEETLTEDELKTEDETTEDLENEELEDNETDESEDESAALKVKLTELESTNKGLIKSLTAQRGQRQELQNDILAIKDAIAEARAEATTDDEVEDLEETLSKIPVDFDDDGNMSIDPKYLKPQGNPDIKALQDELTALKGTVNAQTTASYEQNNLNILLNEKEGYTDAYKLVSKSWNYMKNDLFDNYVESKNLKAPATSDQAIDMIMESTELKEAFAKKYPTLDLESVIEAHLVGTPRYMRKALDKAITTSDSKHETLDFSKPNSLSLANSSGSDTPESLLQRVADMDTEDYENLPAATLAKIDKLLAKVG